MKAEHCINRSRPKGYTVNSTSIVATIEISTVTIITKAAEASMKSHLSPLPGAKFSKCHYMHEATRLQLQKPNLDLAT